MNSRIPPFVLSVSATALAFGIASCSSLPPVPEAKAPIGTATVGVGPRHGGAQPGYPVGGFSATGRDQPAEPGIPSSPATKTGAPATHGGALGDRTVADLQPKVVSVPEAQPIPMTVGAARVGVGPSHGGARSGVSAPQPEAMAAEATEPPAVGAFLALVPVRLVTTQEIANGCWARLYDQSNFGGDALAVIGPVHIAEMRTGDTEIGRVYDSVAVGPKAKLIVYDDEHFRRKSATFNAGQSVADLDANLGYFETIRSLKLNCFA